MAEDGGGPLPPPETTINIADNKDRAIRDYATPKYNQLNTGVNRPGLTATHFEYNQPKPVMFQMIQAMGQFTGTSEEDQHSHLKSFLEMTDHFRIPGVTTEALRLTLFSYTLKERAKAWLNSQPTETVNTWNSLAEKFLKNIFLQQKMSE